MTHRERTETVERQDASGTVGHRLKGCIAGEGKPPAHPTWDSWGSCEFPAPPPPEHFTQFRAMVAPRHPERNV